MSSPPGSGWLRRVPALLIRLGASRPRAVLLAVALVVAASVAVASRLGVDSELLSLLPTHNRAVREFATTVERFGSADIVLLVVRLGPDREGDLAFAEALASRVQASGLVDWLEYRTDVARDLAGPLLDYALLFLDPEEARRLLDELDGPGLEDAARRARQRLIALPGSAPLLRHDPLQLLPRVLSRVGPSRLGGRLGDGSGYLVDPTGELLLMVAKPSRPAADLSFSRRLVAGLDTAREQAVADWHAQGFAGEPAAVELGGGPVIAVEDSRLVVRDLLVGSGSSAAAVLMLFLVAFRRPGALVLALLPLLTGIAVTFALATLLLGRLNSLTASCGALLMGLGVDFVIVLYGRYASERAAGLEHAEALQRLGGHTASGIAIGAVTTAASFLAFLVVDFPGLSQLGVLTGVGILLIAVAVFLVVPALLSVGGDRAQWRGHHLVAGFGADRLCRGSLRRPRVTVLVAVLAMALATGAALHLRFDGDVRNLRSATNRGSRVQEEVADRFGLRFSPLTVRVDGADENQALARAQMLVPELRRLVDGVHLAGVDTVADAVPPIHQQREVVAELAARELDLDRVLRDLEAALRAEGLDPVAFADGFAHLRRTLAVTRPLRLSDLLDTPLGPLVQRCLWVGERGASAAVYCYPPETKWRGAPPEALVAVAEAGGGVVTGPVVVSAELRRAVMREAPRAALLGLVLVGLLLVADLGRLRDGLLALVPLALGTVGMLGAMAALELPLNLLNAFVLTMVLGIAVDYGVHVLHRHRESNGSPEAVAETAKAVAVAALTTVAGFGSLALSHYPGLRSMGLAVVFGATASALAAVTLLPALLRLLEPREG